MPVIKSAKKKLRQDKKRTIQNLSVKDTMKELVKKAKAKPTAESVRLATQAIDKAAKKFILHRNTASRMKSGLSKLISGKPSVKKAETAPVAKAKDEKKTSKPAVKTAKKASPKASKKSAKK